ncbi:MAG TPA: hypothetical protein PLF32_03915 [Bacteroidales bacterium]|nr:hypothetical protein [Bacteroidales bacterium]HOR81778.1 hypothetical protein [Bacteroidales bacterium]HPJ92201.1 hypothetical protein [Bacteroidales bacterium]
MKIYILFVLLFVCISCNTKERKNSTFKDSIDSVLKVNSREYINDKISVIESSKQIEGKHIGYGGQISGIYSCYEILLKNISDSLWIELSYSKSPVMRYYAYQALLSKGNIKFLSVWNRLRKDTSSVCFQTCDVIFGGDLGFHIKNLFYNYSNYNDLYFEYYKRLHGEENRMTLHVPYGNEAKRNQDFIKILQKELRIGGFHVDDCNKIMKEELKIKEFNILDSMLSESKIDS